MSALLTSFVAEPCMSGAGSGGFALVRSPDQQVLLYDFFCQAPCDKHPDKNLEFLPVEVDFGSATEIFYTGRASIACPGTIDGLFTLHEHWGRMPLRDIFQPAIELATSGLEITAFQQYYFSLLKDILARDEQGREVFFNGEELKKPGEMLFMNSLADFLEVLSIEGRDFFYLGEPAQTASLDLQANGSLNSRDFKSYATEIRRPLNKCWDHWRWFSNPDPSLGGAVQWAIIEEWMNSALQRIDSLRDILQIKDVLEYSDLLRRNPERLFDKYFKRNYRGGDTAQRNRHYGSTTHFNVIDEDGLGIGLTVSIGEGSGYFIPDTGVQLNNCLGETALLPGGLHSWIPNKRLISLMCPTMLQDERNGDYIMLGTGGAGRIPSALAQVILNIAWREMTLHDAVEAPRAHWQEDLFRFERGRFPGEYEELLRSREEINIWPEKHLYFGGIQASSFRGHKMQAASDRRREGAALAT